jgi:hypothetical protein
MSERALSPERRDELTQALAAHTMGLAKIGGRSVLVCRCSKAFGTHPSHLAHMLAPLMARWLNEERRGIQFRVETACDGYASLGIDDIPEGVWSDSDYCDGAADAALAIRAALAGDQGEDPA